MALSSRWRSSWGLAALIVVLAGLFLFFTRDNEAVPVRLTKVERGDIVSALSTNGKVEPVEPSELRAEAPASVRKVLVKEGDRVKKGQPLIELERAEASAAAARAEAELQAAEADFENVERGGTAAETHELESRLQKARDERAEAARQLAISERLLARNAAPRMEVEQNRDRLRKAEQELAYLEQRRARRFDRRDRERAQARVKEARAARTLARLRLASMTVTSPVDGAVYVLAVRPGNFVNRGDLLSRIADLQRLAVQVYVDEPELGRLARNQEVLITWDGYPGMTWKGQVERLPAGVTTLGTRSVGQVYCTIENSNGRLLPNVNVNVQIITRRSTDTLSVLKEAVIHPDSRAGRPGGRPFVFLLEDGRLRRRDVAVGVSNATRTEVRSGLEPGQMVALPSDHKLVDGMRAKAIAEQ